MFQSTRAPLMPLLTAAILMGGAGAALAQGNPPPPQCSTSYMLNGDIILRPSPTFPDLCEIIPSLCDDDDGPLIIYTLAQADLNMSAPLFALDRGDMPPQVASQKVEQRIVETFGALQTNPQVVQAALPQLHQDIVFLTGKVAQDLMSVGQVTAILHGKMIDVLEDGSQSYADSAGGGTVTTTTTGGFEINLFGIKIFVNQTVTTTEPLPGGSSSGGDDYDEECDDNGDCVCTEK